MMKKFMKINSCRRLNSGFERTKQQFQFNEDSSLVLLASTAFVVAGGDEKKAMMKRCFPLEAFMRLHMSTLGKFWWQSHVPLPSFRFHKLSRFPFHQPVSGAASIDAFEKRIRHRSLYLLRRVRLAYKLRNLFKRLRGLALRSRRNVQLQTY